MPIDKFAIRDKVLGDLMDTLDGMEAEKIRSKMGDKLRKDFPGDSLKDAIGSSDENKESRLYEEAEEFDLPGLDELDAMNDKKAKIVK